MPELRFVNVVLRGDCWSNLRVLSIGGSETFQDKVNFFQRELRHIHSKKPRTKTCLKITRHTILDSVRSVAKKQFESLLSIKIHMPFIKYQSSGNSD